MAAVAAVATLTVVALYPAVNLDPGAGLTLRGNASALTWAAGIAPTAVGDDQWAWTFDLTADDVANGIAYKVLVDDDLWQVGANAQVVFPAGSSGTSAFTTTVYPWFGTQAGRYEYVRNVYSPQLQNVRDLVVYLPPSYDENHYKVFGPGSVLYMHDGQNLFNASTSAFGTAWMCQDTVNAMVVQGNMRETIIVGIDNTANRTYELTYSVDPTVGTGGGLDRYLDFMEQTVMPLVQGRYRINADASASGASGRWDILGSSLGGLASCYAAWTRPATYGFAGCMSSSFWWNDEDFNNTIMMKGPPPQAAVYVDSGDSGPDNDDEVQTQTVRDHFEALGFPLVPSVSPVAPPARPLAPFLGYYLDEGGQHSEYYWGARFHVPMSFAYQPTVDVAAPMA